MKSPETLNGELPAEREVWAELQSLLSDPAFHVSERNKCFLRYVTTKLLEGRGGAVKAYTIAVDVFGRPASFDPSKDPIVRIEATRLRAALAHYYGAHGHPGRIRVDLPRGGYLPSFARMSETEEDGGGVSSAHASTWDTARPERTPLSSLLRLSGWRWISVAAAIAVACIAGASLLIPPGKGERSLFSEKPIVSIEFAPSVSTSNAETERLYEQLTANLSRFATLQVMAGKEDGTAAGTASDASASTRTSHYRVVLNYERQGSARTVSWQVLSSTGEILQAGQQAETVASGAIRATVDTLANRLSAQLASYRGIIPAIEMRLELDNPTLGAGCVQRALFAILERLDVKDREDGRACLEQTIASQPGNAEARAILVYALLATKPFEVSKADSERALDLARTAVGIAPNLQRTAAALMLALYHARQPEAAVAAGYKAVALNPNEAVVKAYLGWILFATGQWEEGVRLANDAVETDPLAYYDSGSTLIMDAYRRGTYDEVTKRFAEKPYNRPYLVLLAEIGALAELGRAADAATIIDRLREVQPDFDRTFQTDMEARSLAPELMEKLRAGLIKAGLNVSASPSQPAELH